MKKIAAVTMVYNDPEFLPIWCRYYGTIVGPENCYVIDHGSSDGSTRSLLGFNVIKIPRSPKDNDKRTRFVSRFCTALLEWYDGFLHTDVDEIVAHDQGKYGSMQELFDSLSDHTFTAIGFDVQHDPSSEAPLDLSKPITSQRRWIRFSSSMCKPVLSFRPIEWAPGFHSANAPLKFVDMYLFHLRYFDLGIGLERLHRTRSMPWARPDAGSHQRLADEEFSSLVTRVGRLPKVEFPDVSQEKSPLLPYLQKVKNSEKDFRNNTYSIDLHIFGNELFELPRQFVGRF